MDETAPDGVHNIEYSTMRATLFIAIRRQFKEMIDEPEEQLMKHLKVTAVQ